MLNGRYSFARKQAKDAIKSAKRLTRFAGLPVSTAKKKFSIQRNNIARLAKSALKQSKSFK